MSGFTSSTGAEITTDQIREGIANGQGFSLTNGQLNSAAGTNNYPLSVFNPSNSGKNLLIFSIQVANGSGGLTAFLKLVTSNPAWPNQIAPINLKAGGPASALAATNFTGDTADHAPSSPYLQVVTLASATQELLTDGAAILLPAGNANGLTVYAQTYGAGINSTLIRWIEF